MRFVVLCKSLNNLDYIWLYLHDMRFDWMQFKSQLTCTKQTLELNFMGSGQFIVCGCGLDCSGWGLAISWDDVHVWAHSGA